jgi:hypothetical protein
MTYMNSTNISSIKQNSSKKKKTKTKPSIKNSIPSPNKPSMFGAVSANLLKFRNNQIDNKILMDHRCCKRKAIGQIK